MSEPLKKANPGNNNRKVSSRRKALQEFYHITPEEENRYPDINNREEIAQFIANSSVSQLLKFRNDLNHKLSSSNQNKRSIIYDNYSELIKVSNTLSDLSEFSAKVESQSKLKGFGISEEKVDIENTLNDLSNFLDTETEKFKGTFEEVLVKNGQAVQHPNEQTQKIVDTINYITTEKDPQVIDNIMNQNSNELLLLQLNNLKKA